jgi:hypothetical protein
VSVIGECVEEWPRHRVRPFGAGSASTVPPPQQTDAVELAARPLPIHSAVIQGPLRVIRRTEAWSLAAHESVSSERRRHMSAVVHGLVPPP